MAMFHVENRRSAQPVDLQPYGNTISVEAQSDNPFEDAQDVEVVTQMSGGMAGPDPRMRSRAIVTKPSRERLQFAGKVRATRSVAPAHLQHRSFIPGLSGLGADPVPMGPPAPPTAPGTDYSWIGTGLTAAAGAAQAALAAKAADANARAAASNVAAQNLISQRNALLSTVTPSGQNMAAHKGISGTMIVVGLAAAVAAVVLFMKKSGKK